jgi:hypothetical protein
MSLGSIGLLTVSRIGTRAYYWADAQRVAVGATSAQSSAIADRGVTRGAGSLEVLVHTTTDCYIIAGSDPTATASNGIPLVAGEKFHLRINGGEKIAVIRASEDGFLHIVPVDD